MSEICGVVSHSGPNGEPLACAWESGHDGIHSWGTLPTFGARDVEREAARYLRNSDVDVWTAIVNLTREQNGSVFIMAKLYAQAMRMLAEELQGKR